MAGAKSKHANGGSVRGQTGSPNFRFIQHLWIPLTDGIRLAASVYLPSTGGPHPTLISFYPYRKDDLFGAQSASTARALARRGYASVLVDVRGTGASDGAIPAAFALGEQARDAIDAIDWIRSQEWCNRDVGLWGRSYGACLALMIASRRPAGLAAGAIQYGSADLLRDYLAPGGWDNMLASGLREVMMLAMDLAPPSREDTGDLRRRWVARFHSLGDRPVSPIELRQQRSSEDFWWERRIPVEDVETPILAIAGWYDVLLDGTIDIWDRLRAPKRLIVGPWGHTRPESATTEPRDSSSLLADWFDEWMPRRPAPHGNSAVATFFSLGGGWRASDSWPPAAVDSRFYLTSSGGLATERDTEPQFLSYCGEATVGVTSGLWESAGLGVGLPRDQNEDDRRSLVFETDPLPRMEVAGQARMRIFIEVVQGRDCQLAVKVSRLRDGASTFLTRGLTRVSGASGDVHETQVVDIRLSAASFLLGERDRLRLSISTSDYPRVWPTEHRPEIRVWAGGDRASWISLPVLQAGTTRDPDPLPIAPGDEDLDPWGTASRVSHSTKVDHVTGATEVVIGADRTIQRPDGGVFTLSFDGSAIASADGDLAEFVGSSCVSVTASGGSRAEVVAQGRMQRDSLRLEAVGVLDGEQVFAKVWNVRGEQS